MSRFAPRCLSIDLEVGVRDARIHSFAAIRGDDRESFLHFRHGKLGDALARLDELAEGASFLLGHNLIAFDLPHLAAAKPDLRLLRLPAVDTLWLNPLAFPRNPYHHLVKHYHDGRLQAGHVNDPKPKFLTENYRSTRYIIDAANQVIEPARDRMKAGHPITVDRMRGLEPGGGVMARLDPVGKGRVQFLDVAGDDTAQAVAAVDELVRVSRLDPDFNWARTAIISRDWKGLMPVRAYAEKLGLRVEMANEKLPSVWRLREMQRLVGDLRKRPSAMLTIQDILDVLNEQPPNRWVDLIAEGIAGLARELGNRTIPVPDAIDWLAEWARDVRSAQRGLLLLTAHRSKGLEFDHVVILNGGWKALSKGEDGEAPRRLFYVAMTRARRSLAVVTSGAHAFVRADSDSEVLRMLEMPGRAELPEPDQYQLPDLASVDLSYAGRLKPGTPTHAAIARAKVDDPVKLEQRDGKWMILDADRRVLGRMASSWSPPAGTDLLSGKVGAIVRWRKSDNAESYQGYIKQDEWETVLLELVFRKKCANVKRASIRFTRRDV